MNRKYCGDSVYVEYDGNGLELTTDNGNGPSNRIYLEPEVYASVMQYVSDLRNVARIEAQEETDDG